MPADLPDLVRTEAAIVEMTNAVRLREKLGAVVPDKALEAAARAFAAYLAKTKTFSHTADGRQPSDRAKASGYNFCRIAENLALSSDSRGFETRRLAKETVEGWLNSPGHRANLLAKEVTGIGVAVARVPDVNPKYVMVQLFGRPQSLAIEFQISNSTKSAVTYDLSGKTSMVKPGMGIIHTVCDAAPVVTFQPMAGKTVPKPISAANKTVYVVKDQGGKGVTVETRSRETVD